MCLNLDPTQPNQLVFNTREQGSAWLVKQNLHTNQNTVTVFQTDSFIWFDQIKFDDF